MFIPKLPEDILKFKSNVKRIREDSPFFFVEVVDVLNSLRSLTRRVISASPTFNPGGTKSTLLYSHPFHWGYISEAIVIQASIKVNCITQIIHFQDPHSGCPFYRWNVVRNIRMQFKNVRWMLYRIHSDNKDPDLCRNPTDHFSLASATKCYTNAYKVTNHFPAALKETNLGVG